LEIEEKINQIRWIKRKNAAHFLLSTNGKLKFKDFFSSCSIIYLDKTVKLWKISEKTKRAEGFNLRDDNGIIRSTNNITNLRIPVIRPMELMVEATPKRVFSNAHTYHINSISLNSDQETFLSADDLRINLWHTEVTDQSFSKLIIHTKQKDIKHPQIFCKTISINFCLSKCPIQGHSKITRCFFSLALFPINYEYH
jgi:serine/threonine-protein phosphatase 2A regulatory subunit B